ncbi:ABC transporter permease [Ectobacillus ponti]|uniref:ABC transporter permease n=1 Tax=Ectobacillus ponti TaxID=2961894 RepID=A0AA42BS19_9BACI|nr:ABC transporter permease [Ectobacillus ponti]MCP8970916.1 ABC transporter permease [Ectobacillus ponti]
MNYLIENPQKVLELFLQHVNMLGITLAISLAIALPVGMLISRVSFLYVPVTGLLGILYTIPSLALYAFFIPITGLGPKTAIIGLVVYAQMILVRNVVAAIQGIDPLVIEAAKAMGMTKWQIILKIEVPLAIPVIVAGIRIATVSTISIATVAAWINAGGLGRIIYDGLHHNDFGKIMLGTLLIGLLAILADALFRLIERRTTPKSA